LRNFLPTCTPEQLAEFFGPVTAYLCEGETLDTLLVFQAGQDAPRKETHKLNTPPEASAESHDAESLKAGL
jgi:hypothetical protein